MPRPVTLTFDLLTLKSVCESHVTWGILVQSFVFLGLLVFELEPMYATSDRQTDDGRRSPLNAPAPAPPLRGGGIIIIPRRRETCCCGTCFFVSTFVCLFVIYWKTVTAIGSGSSVPLGHFPLEHVPPNISPARTISVPTYRTLPRLVKVKI